MALWGAADDGVSRPISKSMMRVLMPVLMNDGGDNCAADSLRNRCEKCSVEVKGAVQNGGTTTTL